MLLAFQGLPLGYALTGGNDSWLRGGVDRCRLFQEPMDLQDREITLEHKTWSYPMVTLRYLFLPARNKIASFTISPESIISSKA